MGAFRELVCGKIRPGTDDENAQSVLRHAEIGGIERSPGYLILGLMPGCALVGNDPGIVRLPKFIVLRLDTRESKLSENVIEVRPKRRPSQATNVLQQDCFRLQRTDRPENLGEKIPPVLLGQVFAAKAKWLAWRTGREQPDRLAVRFPFDVGYVGLFDRRR